MDPRDLQPRKDISQTTDPEPSLSTTKSKISMTDKEKGKGKEKSGSSGKGSSSGKDRLASKMNKITNWLSTSEPSANALKQHKKETFQKAGVPLNDPEAPAKIHAPIGKIPRDAIKPAVGPDPEEVVRKKAEQRRKMKKQQQEDRHRKNSTSASASASASYSGASSSLQTPSLSGYSSMSGPESSMFVPGDDDFGANGWGPR